MEMLQSCPKFTLISHLISRLNRCAPRVQLSMSTRRFVHSSISVRGGQQAVGQGQGQEQSSASERANPAPSTQEKADSPALDSSIEIETVAARASANASPNVQPLLFSQTRAVQWSAAKTFRRAPNPDRPWYQGYVISFSTLCFIIYLFVREENDLDEELRKPLWKRVPQLELQTLRRIVAEKRAQGESAEPELRRIEQLLNQHEGLKNQFHKS